MDDNNLNVFDKILAPVIPLIEEAQNNIPNDAATYTLSFLPFTINILFAIELFLNKLFGAFMTLTICFYYHDIYLGTTLL